MRRILMVSSNSILLAEGVRKQIIFIHEMSHIDSKQKMGKKLEKRSRRGHKRLRIKEVKEESLPFGTEMDGDTMLKTAIHSISKPDEISF